MASPLVPRSELTTEHWAQLRRDGFLAVQGAIDGEGIDALKSAIREWQERDAPDVRAQHARLHDTKTVASFGLEPDPEALVSALRALLVTLTGERWTPRGSRIVFKRAVGDKGAPWHQDWHYHRGAHRYRVWIPLHAMSVSSGCLRVIPGSQSEALPHVPAIGTGWRLKIKRPQEELDAGAVDVETALGDLVLFSDLTAHASRPNGAAADLWAITCDLQQDVAA